MASQYLSSEIPQKKKNSISSEKGGSFRKTVSDNSIISNSRKWNWMDHETHDRIDRINSIILDVNMDLRDQALINKVLKEN